MKKLLNKELGGLKLWWLLIPFGVALVFFIIGTFLDLNISKAIVDQSNLYGIFFEGWGMYLPFLVGSLGATALGSGLYKLEKKIWKMLAYVSLGVGIIVFTYLTHHYIVKYFAGGAYFHELGVAGTILSYAISFVLISIPNGLCFFLVFNKYEDKEKLIRVGAFILLWIMIGYGILEIVKSACYRPRFRFLYGYMFDEEGNKVICSDVYGFFGDDLYRPWYLDWQWFSKAKYSEIIVESDCIKSFPSGHTGMCTPMLLTPMLLPFFGLKEDKLKLWQPITFGIGFIYLIMLALGRVVCGAHWVSDVTMATMIVILVGVLLMVVNNLIIIKKKN